MPYSYKKVEFLYLNQKLEKKNLRIKEKQWSKQLRIIHQTHLNGRRKAYASLSAPSKKYTSPKSIASYGISKEASAHSCSIRELSYLLDQKSSRPPLGNRRMTIQLSAFAKSLSGQCERVISYALI